MKTEAGASDRIRRIRQRYQEGVPRISIERARYFTESWRETEGNGTPVEVRAAMAMKNVFEKITHYIDPDDRIAGTWTESYLGIPIDIERGLFNEVLRTELDKGPMMRFRLGSILKALAYVVRKLDFREFRRSMKAMGDASVPMDMKFRTMEERKINPFAIDPEDKRVLQKGLLPFWKGRTVADAVKEELDRSSIFSKEERKLVDAITITPTRQVMILSPASTICTYQGHLVLDHETILRKGLLAVRDEVREKIHMGDELPEGEAAFLRSIEIALDGVIVFAERLSGKLKEVVDSREDDSKKACFGEMLKCCLKVPLRPAETFREAVQSLWTVRTAAELAHPFNVHGLGRLDQILYPYYRADLKAGRITRAEARELMEELLLKAMSQIMRPESNLLGDFYHRFEGSEPVTLGGLTPEGEGATNELTYVILEAAERSRSILNVVVRVHETSPDDLLLAVADKLHKGASNISLMNDEVNMEALERRGVSPEDARDYAITGCTDVICPGKTGGLSVSGLQLCKVLDIMLRNGHARIPLGLVRDAGTRTGDPDSFTTFDQVKDAYVSQASHVIRQIVEASNLRDRVFAEKMPAPIISAFMQGCLEQKRDVTRGGAPYDLSLLNMLNSFANVADSLYVIKKCIFEERRFSFKELLDAIDSNFAGHEETLRMISKVDGRWGNGNREVDELAREITTRLFEKTYEHRTYRRGAWAPVMNSMTAHTVEGRISIATPDGRKAATPYAASCNPSNVDRSGITGVLRSVAGLDFRHVLGCAVNIRLHPSAIGSGEATRRKWAALIRTYFAMGGEQIQPTVASAEILRAAQEAPDGYRDLIVKVGGYSVYFVELGREIQDEVIARSEHAAAA